MMQKIYRVDDDDGDYQDIPTLKILSHLNCFNSEDYFIWTHMNEINISQYSNNFFLDTPSKPFKEWLEIFLNDKLIN